MIDASADLALESAASHFHFTLPLYSAHLPEDFSSITPGALITYSL